jgi:hypothetical protein
VSLLVLRYPSPSPYTSALFLRLLLYRSTKGPHLLDAIVHESFAQFNRFVWGFSGVNERTSLLPK